MENANDFIALEGAATRQCLAILHQPPVPNHHPLAFFLHFNAGCICESGNVLQGIAL